MLDYGSKLSFVDLISKTRIHTLHFCAGSIIRCMRRLEEVLRQMCSAAKAIGNTELENKFAEGKKRETVHFHKYDLPFSIYIYRHFSIFSAMLKYIF